YSDKNEYKYLLEGQDKKWVELGNKNEITFANLPSGNYNLKIIGANNDGVWNYKAAVLSIKVNPPFWANNYYRAVFVLFILSVISVMIVKKIKTLKTEKEIQFQYSKLMIEAQEEERKRVSQELHDSLGQNLLVIKNQLDIFTDSGMKDRNELESISELVKESISEVKEISSNLHPHQLERLGLSKAIKAMLNKASQASSISIEPNIEDISGLFTRDREINIYRIIQESLNNILKHSSAKIARLELYKNGDLVVISIEDDGRGFDASNKEMENKFKDGLGLKSIKERARLLKGILSIESSIGRGTKITVTINNEK
ncbi:MAG: triple tyrosine motif-containing protein, partial [Ignavibacteria bacterium]|nr:triple tyrosine motif-containing protein [Ignavibacteria bacterium]